MGKERKEMEWKARGKRREEGREKANGREEIKEIKLKIAGWERK